MPRVSGRQRFVRHDTEANLWQRFHPVAVTFGLYASVRRVSLVLCPNTFHSHKHHSPLVNLIQNPLVVWWILHSTDAGTLS